MSGLMSADWNLKMSGPVLFLCSIQNLLIYFSCFYEFLLTPTDISKTLTC